MAAPIKTRFLSGSMWMVSWRWAQRGLGLISVVILARLLAPEDFGLVAMATIVVGLLGILSEAGVNSALIYRESIQDEHLDTGWTIRIIQHLLVALLLIPAAHLGAAYFNEARIVPVIYVLAASFFINGLENIGTIYFQRDLNFKKDFVFGFSHKLASFVVTIVLAVLLKNYWALVLGSVSGVLFRVVISYFMHPYRPAFSLRAFSELWDYSKWVMVFSLVRYTGRQADKVAVGGELSSVAMGQYSVAFELATLPTTEVVVPVSRALFPNYSRIAHQADVLKAAFLKTLGTTMLMTSAIGIGLASVAESFVHVVLGEKWSMVIPIVEWLALLGVLASANFLIRPMLMAVGKTKTMTVLETIQFLITVPIVFFAAAQGEVEMVAAGRVAAILIILPITYQVVMRYLDIRVLELFSMVWRPLVSAGLMAAVLFGMGDMGIGGYLLLLLVQVLLGAMVFLLSELMLCLLVGLHSTLEYEIISVLFSRLRLTQRFQRD